MQCPKCRKTKNKVIDSRPTKDKSSIWRRRECLACSTRFTTFEATEQSLLSVLIRQNTGRGVTLNSLKAMLYFMANTLSSLSEETERLAERMIQLEMIEQRRELKQKSDKKPQKAAGKKARIGKKASGKKKIAGRIIGTTATDTILKIIQRFKRGVAISILKGRTGWDDKKIRNILYRLSTQGRIKKISQGVYTLA